MNDFDVSENDDFEELKIYEFKNIQDKFIHKGNNNKQ